MEEKSVLVFKASNDHVHILPRAKRLLSWLADEVKYIPDQHLYVVTEKSNISTVMSNIGVPLYSLYKQGTTEWVERLKPGTRLLDVDGNLGEIWVVAETGETKTLRNPQSGAEEHFAPAEIASKFIVM